MRDAVKDKLRKLGYEESIKAVECGFCPLCGNPVATNEFTDNIAREQFDLTGLCGECQRNVIDPFPDSNRERVSTFLNKAKHKKNFKQKLSDWWYNGNK